MDCRNKKILVVGLAKTGVACARFLASQGARVTVTDMRERDRPGRRHWRNWQGSTSRWVLERHDEATFLASDLIVVSPGVPDGSPAAGCGTARRTGDHQRDRTGRRFITAPLVAITGTNGKTTTTTILAARSSKHNGYAHLCRRQHRRPADRTGGIAPDRGSGGGRDQLVPAGVDQQRSARPWRPCSTSARIISTAMPVIRTTSTPSCASSRTRPKTILPWSTGMIRWSGSMPRVSRRRCFPSAAQ